MSIVDLSRRRWQNAKNCEDASAVDTLKEASAQIADGTLNAKSVLVVALCELDDGCTQIELFHAGPATTNERLGMLVRAQAIMLDPQ